MNPMKALKILTRWLALSPLCMYFCISQTRKENFYSSNSNMNFQGIIAHKSKHLNLMHNSKVGNKI